MQLQVYDSENKDSHTSKGLGIRRPASLKDMDVEKNLKREQKKTSSKERSE